MQERNLYLSNVDADEAVETFFSSLDRRGFKPQTEIIDITGSLGRTTAEAVYAKLSSPNFNASAMDGIAVEAIKTFGASETKPLRLKKHIDYIYVDTGDPIHPPYDAVIMIEDVVDIDEDTVEIIKAAYVWQHIRPIGEDIVAHEMIIPEKHVIRAVDIAAMLSGGLVEAAVYQKPRVALLPTGTEIIEPGQPVAVGKIIESNSRIFENLTIQYGGQPVRYAPIPDDYNLLKQKLTEAAKYNDIIVVNAGSSAGSEDFTAGLIGELGEVLVHGVAIKPGKPAILGFIDNKPVIGIPGYPVSAYFVFEIFVKPLIMKYTGRQTPKDSVAEAVLSRRVVSSLKHKELVRVKLGRVDEKLIATPLNRGAGSNMSLVRADGVLVIPQSSEGIEAGDKVDIRLMRPLSVIENTIVSIGSHDLAIDIIGSLIHRQNSSYSLSSAHVGSMGGLMAIRKGEAHIAPVHLMDEHTGAYNVSYIKKYLPGIEMALIKGLKRVQGMMVKKGNPKQITSINDLSRKDIRFANRQKGAGTRLLADCLLARAGIEAGKIIGYEREMTTHMAVAAAVASDAADIGLGVFSAAKALELDFIPIGDEEYDFAVPAKYLKENMIQLFIYCLKSRELHKELEKLGGYSTQGAGEIIIL